MRFAHCRDVIISLNLRCSAHCAAAETAPPGPMKEDDDDRAGETDRNEAERCGAEQQPAGMLGPGAWLLLLIAVAGRPNRGPVKRKRIQLNGSGLPGRIAAVHLSHVLAFLLSPPFRKPNLSLLGGGERETAMAEAQAQVPAQGPVEAPLDVSAIRSRVEQLSLERQRLGRGEEEQAEVAHAEVELGLFSACKVAQEAMVGWDSTTAAVSIDDLDAYLEMLRNEVAMAEEGNQKVSGEISVTVETTFNDKIQMDVGIERLEALFSNLGPKALHHFDESSVLRVSDTDSCRNQSIGDKDYMYELELDHQIEKSMMGLEILQHLQREDEMFQLESMLLPFGAKILDFKDNCLRIFVKAPILDCEIYGQKFNCPIDSFISDHELLIEIDKRNMEPKKVQIIPDDLSVDILIDRIESSREAISYPTLPWLIQQCVHQCIINSLRRSLVNDANSSRHSFEYFNKEEVIVAHLDRGIDVFIKISSDWPLCSYGLKLISIRNSGDRPTNIASTLLSKTKELANELELQIRQHLLTFVDAVEEILIRELRSC